MDNKQQLAAVAAMFLLVKRKHRRKQRSRSCWVKPWLLLRQQQGMYHNLVTEFRLQDEDNFRGILRLDVNSFEQLLLMVSPLVVKETTRMRKPISPGERLSVTLRFLATGESFRSLSYQYRIHWTTIGEIVPETCRAIAKVLKEYYSVPQTPEEWEKVAEGFLQGWQFPNCLGALDGKHITLRSPQLSGSMFYNYKNTFSIVLMAVVDSDYKFLYVDVGSQGRVSDGGVFKECSLSVALQEGSLNIPPPTNLPGTQNECPYMFVGDEAFPLQSNIMKPHARRNLTHQEKVFNYRLSRARRVVENAFGILSARFRVFLTRIGLEPEKVQDIVHASCSLHNWLRATNGDLYTPRADLDQEIVEERRVQQGAWRQDGGMQHITRGYARNATIAAKEQRGLLAEYFLSPQGSVPWQDVMI